VSNRIESATVVGVPLTCSAKGCTATARWSLQWNNPRLHPPERRKSWLACEQHRTTLGEFLGARGFLREVEPVPGTPLEPDAGDPPGRQARATPADDVP
jgi:hypothetical protein